MDWEHDYFERAEASKHEFAPRWLNVTYDDILPMNMRFGDQSLSMAEIGNLLDGSFGADSAGTAEQGSADMQDTSGKATGPAHIPAHPQHDSGHSEQREDNQQAGAILYSDETMNVAIADLEADISTVLGDADDVLAGNVSSSNVEISNTSEQDPLLAALGMGAGDVSPVAGESTMAGLSSKLNSADGFSADQSALLLAAGVSSVDAIRRRKM